MLTTDNSSFWGHQIMRTPKTRRTFLEIAILIWLFVPIADALSLILYTTILTPLNAKPLSPGDTFAGWQFFATYWIILSPLVLSPVAFPALLYSGSRKLLSFNRCYPLRSLISWILYGGLAAMSIFLASLGKEHLFQVPKAVSGLLFAYLFLLCNAVMINGDK